MHWQHSKDLKETNTLIKRWLNDRQNLLIRFNELCHLSTSKLERLSHSAEEKGNTEEPSEQKARRSEMLNTFCQLLIDYVSAGHFEIFEKIEETESQYSTDSVLLDRDLVVKILRTTNDALNFNDKYASRNLNNLSASPISKDSNLKADLSYLGEQLANRWDWEDQIIKTYVEITQPDRMDPKKSSRLSI